MCTYLAVLVFTLATNAYTRVLFCTGVRAMIDYREETFYSDEDSIPQFE